MFRSLGLDFGTTNTVLAVCGADGRAHPLSLRMGDERIAALRSALCVQKTSAIGAPLSIEAGPWAIRHYIDDPDERRFIQSFKTFAASQDFQETRIFNQRFAFEDLLSVFLRRILDYGEDSLPVLPRRLVVGRPVSFAGARPDEALAMSRYRAGLKDFGFDEVLYVYEPVAAAFYFAQSLKQSATILVADLGGGTTDYSLMRFELESGRIRPIPIAQGGVGIAGDAFDFRIIDNAILPFIGKGSRYRSMGKILELPTALFSNFARWNLLSLLKNSKEYRDLKRLLPWCEEQEKIQRFVDLVDDDQGYALYMAVSEAKTRLSVESETEFNFAPLGPDFRAVLRRADFDHWIAGDLARIEAALDGTLAKAQLADHQIDTVFLTGGTSFVPAVRSLFERRFGAAHIQSGDELLSIANGLALIGDRDDAALWAA